MAKRAREEDYSDVLSSKRPRMTSPFGNANRLSLLSDELLLRTLSYLSVSELVLCERLSRRLQALAGDSQLWKSLFYDQFVRPRASQIPGLRDQGSWPKSLFYSSKASKWLDDSHLAQRGNATNWKQQFKLRHNWSKGSARISETTVAEKPSAAPLLLRLQDDIVVVADGNNGLRVWALKGNGGLVASRTLSPGIPTALAIDDAATSNRGTNIVLGFEDGSFAIFTFGREKGHITLHYCHAASAHGAIHAIAYASPYLLTMTGGPLLSLYQVQSVPEDPVIDGIDPPRLLSSLRSHTAYPPISLALRNSPADIVASIAYAVPTWAVGWSVGLQEVRMTTKGGMAKSRIAFAPSESTSTSSTQSAAARHLPSSHPNGLSHMPGLGRGRLESLTEPTSLSYKHPYLLSAHADNTLTLYLVTSNAEELSIGSGSRLWGHTSSITTALLGERGKAVSVGASGNELRVWELEGGLMSKMFKRRAAAGASSVQVRAEKKRLSRISGKEESLYRGVARFVRSISIPEQDPGQAYTTHGWVAFDEEKVVLLREKVQGAQALVVYDFS